MKYAQLLASVMIVILGVGLTPGRRLDSLGLNQPTLIARADAAPVQWSGPACQPPAAVMGSPAETAWRIWVAATCPVNSVQYPYVVWENWLEQYQMYPANPALGLTVPNAGATVTPHLLHGSPLGFLNGLPSDPSTGCTITTNPNNPTQQLVICEEVRLNGPSEDYVAANRIWRRSGQQTAANSGASDAAIQFPTPSVEIKADWIELASCVNPPAGVHVEQIGSTCFALAGMHLISKLKKNWIWATFEPQNLTTNPNRCLVLGCYDPWGSSPPRSGGGPTGNTQLSTSLANLMAQAGLANDWTNYRLDGVQTSFVGANGKPILLGNSIIEGENAGVPLNQSSCISCHSLSSIEQNGTDGITLLNSNPVGRPEPLPSSSWIHRDFVWSLSEACGDSLFQTCSGP
jgi:hypothetical protein